MSELGMVRRQARFLYTLEPMTVRDIPEVMDIERATFSNPWSREAFEYEVVENPVSHPVVARSAVPGEGRVAGYCVKWVVFENLHIQNIAVDPQHQRRGLGRTLLEDAMNAGRRAGATRVLLEVRESNTAAQRLYESMGFKQTGRRKGYYSRPAEDAILYERDLRDPGS